MKASQEISVPLVHRDFATSAAEKALLFEEDVHESEIGHFVNGATQSSTNLVQPISNNANVAVKSVEYSICYWCLHDSFQELLKELEEFAFKGIPDVRGCKVQDAQLLEEIVSEAVWFWFVPNSSLDDKESHAREHSNEQQMRTVQ